MSSEPVKVSRPFRYVRQLEKKLPDAIRTKGDQDGTALGLFHRFGGATTAIDVKFAAPMLRPSAVRYDLQHERPGTNNQPETEYGGHDMNRHDELPCDPQDLDEMAADQADWDSRDDGVAADRDGWDGGDDDSAELQWQLPLFVNAQPEHVQERDLAQHPYEPIGREEDDDGLPFGPRDAASR